MRFKQTMALSLSAFGIFWGGDILRAAVPVQEIPTNGIILQAVPGSRVLRQGKEIAPEAGMFLYPNDRLQTVVGEPLWVQCDDLTLQTLAGGGVRGNECPVASALKCPDDIIQCPHRGDLMLWRDASIPYIISPRRTGLLNPQPLLRWNPVAGASHYTVTIRGANLKWTVETDESQIIYSGETPLQPGEHYLLNELPHRVDGWGFSNPNIVCTARV